MSDELKQAAEEVLYKFEECRYTEFGKLKETPCVKLARAYLAECDADATDYAHPSWWRGQEAGGNAICERVNAILDGKDDGSGVAGEPWESTRRRLLAMKAELERRAVAVQCAQSGGPVSV